VYTRVLILTGFAIWINDFALLRAAKPGPLRAKLSARDSGTRLVAKDRRETRDGQSSRRISSMPNPPSHLPSPRISRRRIIGSRCSVRVRREPRALFGSRAIVVASSFLVTLFISSRLDDASWKWRLHPRGRADPRGKEILLKTTDRRTRSRSFLLRARIVAIRGYLDDINRRVRSCDTHLITEECISRWSLLSAVARYQLLGFRNSSPCEARRALQRRFQKATRSA